MCDDGFLAIFQLPGTVLVAGIVLLLADLVSLCVELNLAAIFAIACTAKTIGFAG